MRLTLILRCFCDFACTQHSFLCFFLQWDIEVTKRVAKRRQAAVAPRTECIDYTKTVHDDSTVAAGKRWCVAEYHLAAPLKLTEAQNVKLLIVSPNLNKTANVDNFRPQYVLLIK